jgi:hypothetical protein
MILFDGVGNCQTFLFPQVMVELADAIQMAVNGLRRQPLPHEMINVT